MKQSKIYFLLGLAILLINLYFQGSGDTKALEPNDSGIGPGRFMALHQTILLKEAIEKLKSHLRLPHLRLALGVNDNKGR